ncbi:MAG: chromate transporter [Bradyrhizobiaceae bacterium]|nr:chromate transporter [Bradyrhizobiaceae bacterium]
MNVRIAKLSEIASGFNKIGAVSYGVPAIIGIMQTEVQERRQWIATPDFIEGLALVNMLPGPGASQLAIFVGHARAGVLGGILAGVCFVLPAFTFGDGLSMLAFIQEQVVNQLASVTPQEFLDGLALGQLTPGPILMLAAFLGFKLFGLKGAAVAASAIILPSMMLAITPLLRKVKDLQWLKAFMRGVAPAAIGALAVAMAHMAPRAAPDIFAWCVLMLTVAIILLRNVGPPALVSGGAVVGLLSKGRGWEMIQGFIR